MKQAYLFFLNFILLQRKNVKAQCGGSIQDGSSAIEPPMDSANPTRYDKGRFSDKKFG